MNFKSNIRLFITYFVVFIFVTFWVVSVFSTDLIFEPNILEKELLGNNIFLDSDTLNTNYISFSSNGDLSKYILSSSCNIESKFAWSYGDNYLFKFKYLDKCYNWTIFLKTSENIILKKSFIDVTVLDRTKIFDLYVDNNNSSLSKINDKLVKTILQLQYSIKKVKIKDYDYLKLKRKLEELKYHESFLNDILNNRNSKYLTPVKGYNISTDTNKIPNAGRPYRSDYTDGIHHGWDVMAPIGSEVRSLDYGKIVKIVRDFKFSDLNNIKKWVNLTYEQKLINLDILRWNQVWLKTSKWDLIFYSHMEGIPADLKNGSIIWRDTFIWKVWISWIPSKSYNDYHLHFPIMKNPYIKNKIWRYDLMDYMKWDWYFKWKSLDYVINNQKNIFY